MSIRRVVWFVNMTRPITLVYFKYLQLFICILTGTSICVINSFLSVKLDNEYHSVITTNVLLRHCLILTQDVSLQPTRLTPYLSCIPFIAESFAEYQFHLVSDHGQAKLRNTWLMHDSADLSNNGSVNIFVNHLKMWKHVVEVLRSPTLILEEDVLLAAPLVPKLEELLQSFQRDSVSNYVVKLDSGSFGSSMWVRLQWLNQYNIHKHVVKKCMCRPHHISSSSAAYIVDTQAADKLIRNAHPLNMHVDVYKHFMGCVYRLINIYAFSPAVVRAHVRPSVHWRDSSSWHRAYLLAVEFVEGVQLGTCPLGIHTIISNWL